LPVSWFGAFDGPPEAQIEPLDQAVKLGKRGRPKKDEEKGAELGPDGQASAGEPSVDSQRVS
jgi:hypothetical protein